MLAKNAGQIKQDVRHVNEFIASSRQFIKTRKSLIVLLNTTANELEILLENTRTADIAGTTVSIIGGTLATGTLLLTGGVSWPIAVGGAAQLSGTVTSIVAQVHREKATKELLRQVREQLERHSKDVIEIKRLLHTLNQVSQRLNIFLPLLRQIVRIGFDSVKQLIKIANKTEEITVDEALRLIKQIVGEANFVTFINNTNVDSDSENIKTSNDRTDSWTDEIYSLKSIVSLANIVIPLVAPNILGFRQCASTAAETTAPAVTTMKCVATTTLVLLNTLAIGCDAYHLVTILKKDHPRYIKDLCGLAEELQWQVDQKEKQLLQQTRKEIAKEQCALQ